MQTQFRQRKIGGILRIVGIIWILGAALNGCSTPHQVLRYEGSVMEDTHLIPGIEPGESARKIMVSVKGEGLSPENGSAEQKRFMAERAAVIDGYRKLSERLAGLILNAQAQSGANTLSHDQVVIETNAYLRGAQVGGVTYHDGYATADVKVYLEPRESRFMPRIGSDHSLF
jgi:hypothetical protein